MCPCCRGQPAPSTGAVSEPAPARTVQHEVRAVHTPNATELGRVPSRGLHTPPSWWGHATRSSSWGPWVTLAQRPSSLVLWDHMAVGQLQAHGPTARPRPVCHPLAFSGNHFLLPPLWRAPSQINSQSSVWGWQRLRGAVRTPAPRGLSLPLCPYFPFVILFTHLVFFTLLLLFLI